MFEDNITAQLKTNANLVSIVTGGIYTYAEVGRNGLSPSRTPTAYDSTGALLPTILVRVPHKQEFFGVRDVAKQVKSFRLIAEIFFYIDGNSAVSTFTTMYNEVTKTLDDRFLNNVGRMRELRQVGYDYDPDMNNALFLRTDYQIAYIRGI